MKIKSTFTKWALLSLFCIIVVLNLKAQIIPISDFPPIDGKYLIVDSAHVFTPEARRTLEEKLVAFDNEQSTQILVVTIKDLGPYDISQYSTELGHHYGVGNKGKDNGIIILFALNNRKVNIATGYGTEGKITDGIAGTIIRNEMIPYFKQGLYEQGLTKGALTVMQYLNGEYTNDKQQLNNEDAPPLAFIIIIIFVVIALMMFMGKGGGGKGGGQYMSRRGSDFLTGAILGEILSGGRSRGGGFGGGGFGSGSSGGFGGFGGGGFGGGGASGSW